MRHRVIDSRLKESFELAKEIAEFIVMHDSSSSILSVYGMGSFAEGRSDQANDIDLSIIIKDSYFQNLKVLKKSIQKATTHFKIKIDTNFLCEKELREEVLNSKVFPHKGRHAFLIYELVFYNFHLFGENILTRAKFQTSEFISNAVKLILTLGYRLRKMYFTDKVNMDELTRQSIKFATYASKFALLGKGLEIYEDREVLSCFPIHFKDLSIKYNLTYIFVQRMQNLNKITFNEKILTNCYNFIEELGSHVLEKYLKFKATDKFLSTMDERKTAQIKRVFGSSVKFEKYEQNVIMSSEPHIVLMDSIDLLKHFSRENGHLVILIKPENKDFGSDAPGDVDYIMAIEDLRRFYYHERY